MQNCFGEIGAQTKNYIAKAAVSNRTVARWIGNKSYHITEKLTDNRSIARNWWFVVFIKTVNTNFEPYEDLFHCSLLFGSTKGVDIINKIKSVFETEQLGFKKLAAVTTYEAPAMTSPNICVISLF